MLLDEWRQRCETIRDAAAWHASTPGELFDWLSAAAARAGSLELAEPATWASSLECLSWTLSMRLSEARAVLDEGSFAELVDGLLCGAAAAWEARRGQRGGE